MTNLEFLQFVIEDRKIPYDTQLVNLLHNYFKFTIEELEKQENFNYMRRDTYATLLANNYYINFTEDIKSFQEVIDKKRGWRLIGDEETKVLYLYRADKVGTPTRYFYSSADRRLYFNCKVAEPTDYIISYYVFTYNTPLVNLNATHPLLEENKALLLHSLSVWVERFYTMDLNYEAQRANYYKTLERSVQLKKRFTKTLIKFNFPRY